MAESMMQESVRLAREQAQRQIEEQRRQSAAGQASQVGIGGASGNVGTPPVGVISQILGGGLSSAAGGGAAGGSGDE